MSRGWDVVQEAVSERHIAAQVAEIEKLHGQLELVFRELGRYLREAAELREALEQAEGHMRRSASAMVSKGRP